MSERGLVVCDALDRFRIAGKKTCIPASSLAVSNSGNLHVTQGQDVMELFTKLNQDGATIIKVTHSELTVADGCRVVKLRDGWLVSE